MWLDDLRRDCLYAIRALRREPAFTAVVIVTLALGIGTNTAIFSVVHSVLLRPLPYKDSAQLVRVYENIPGREFGNGKGPDRRFGAMDVRDINGMAGRTRTVTLATFSLAQMTQTIDGESLRMDGFGVSVNLFATLGVPALIGRALTEDDAAANRDHVVVLGYDAWQRLGGRRDIVGKTIRFSGAPGPFSGGLTPELPYTIIGVMPAGFRFPYDNAAYWFPRRVITPPNLPPNARASRETVARVAPGVTLEAAAAEMAALRDEVRGPSAPPAGKPRFELVRLQDELTEPVRPALFALMAAVAVVLLIASVNVANLLLARTAARQREIAVRTAIGAGRGRLIRQLLTESLILSLTGGAVGTLLAYSLVRLFHGLGATLGRVDLAGGATATAFPRLAEVAVDATVLAYALAVSIGTALLFGIVPAARLWRGVRFEVLRESAGATGGALKSMLVIVEMALAMVLLVGSGLMINSFVRLATVNPGFDATRLLTFQIVMSGSPKPDAQRTFAEDIVARFASIPGVQSSAYARQLPMVQLYDTVSLMTVRNGAEQPLGQNAGGGDIRFVSADYLSTMGMRIVSGRGFREASAVGQDNGVLINEALARRDFAGVSPIGETLLLGPAGHRLTLEIIGVVSDARQFGLDREATPQYFLDIRRVPLDPVYRMPPLFPVGVYYTLRTSGNPVAALDGVRSVVRQMDPGAVLEHVATMEQILSNSIVRPRMYAVLVAIFSAVAAALAAIGLYGVMAYMVTSRTREIGIRMALGAQRAAVMALVFRHSVMLAAFGMAIGLASAAAVTRYLQSLLFGVTPLDPATFAAVAIGFALLASVASMVPASRATRVDPLIALRCE